MGTTEDSLSKLWGAFRELAADYWGPNRDNGKRSEVTEHGRRLNDLEDQFRHYVDAERATTCIGKALLAEHEKKHKQDERGDLDMEIQRGKNRTLIVQQWVQIAGLVLVALIGLLK